MLSWPGVTVRKPGGGIPNQPSQPNAELRARNAAGRQANEAPIAAYQRPHRVHTGQEFRIATARKHAAELQEEAHRRSVHEHEGLQALQAAEIEEKERVTGLNFDERRKKKGRQPQDQDEDERDQAEEEAARQLGLGSDKGKLFEDLPEDRLGDLTLLDPNEMKRVLGSPMRFAQHAMVLTAQRQQEGLPREQAVEHLAKLYLGLTDKTYANKALRQFGAATGVLDVYPIEVMQHLLQHAPGFLRKVQLGSFCTAVPKDGYKTTVGKPVVLSYDETLRIRGFALRGGGQPGYLFEPVDPPGTYHLSFADAGTFQVAISALTKDGHLLIEDFEVKVEPRTDQALTPELERMQGESEEAETGADEKKPDELKVIIRRYI